MPKRKRRVNFDDDEDYVASGDVGTDYSEVIIPTPSIDSVLQNLASSALAPAGQNTESRDSTESEDESAGRNNYQRVQPQRERQVAIISQQQQQTQQKRNQLFYRSYRSKRPSIKRIASAQNNHPPLLTRQQQKAAPAATVRVTYGKPNKTLSDLLDQINKQPSSAPSTSKDRNLASSSVATNYLPISKPNRLISLPPASSSPSPYSVVAANNVNRTFITTAGDRTYTVQSAAIDDTVNAVASSSMSKSSSTKPSMVVPHYTPYSHSYERLRSYWPSTSSSSIQFRPIAHQQSTIYKPKQTRRNDDKNNEDVVVVLDSEGEDDGGGGQEQGQQHEEEQEEEASPFCKNCSSEVPLILKSLDRLDTMVNNMISMVKDELEHRRHSQPSTSVVPDNNANQNQSNHPNVIGSASETPANSALSGPKEIVVSMSSSNKASNPDHVNGINGHRSSPISVDGDDGNPLLETDKDTLDPELELAANADLAFSILEHSPDAFDFNKLCDSNPQIRKMTHYHIQLILDELLRLGFLSLLNDEVPLYAKNKRKFAEWKAKRGE